MNVQTRFRVSSYIIYVLADFRDTVPLRALFISFGPIQNITRPVGQENKLSCGRAHLIQPRCDFCEKSENLSTLRTKISKINSERNSFNMLGQSQLTFGQLVSQSLYLMILGLKTLCFKVLLVIDDFTLLYTEVLICLS